MARGGAAEGRQVPSLVAGRAHELVAEGPAGEGEGGPVGKERCSWAQGVGGCMCVRMYQHHSPSTKRGLGFQTCSFWWRSDFFLL